MEAARLGGSAPAILNAANEVAVHGFLGGRIGFLDIARIVERTLAAANHFAITNIADVHAVDAHAREVAGAMIAS